MTIVVLLVGLLTSGRRNSKEMAASLSFRLREACVGKNTYDIYTYMVYIYIYIS